MKKVHLCACLQAVMSSSCRAFHCPDWCFVCATAGFDKFNAG